MNADDFGNVLYLSLLLLAVGGYFVSHFRANIGQALRYALIWGLLFAAVAGAAGLWFDIRSDNIATQDIDKSTGQVTLPQAPDGHYYATLLLEGQPVHFMVDTGASKIVLSQEDAKRAGIDLNTLRYFGRAYTANGEVRTAPAIIKNVDLLGIKDQNVEVWVNEGDMSGSLLGNSYLQRFNKIAIEDGAMSLSR